MSSSQTIEKPAAVSAHTPGPWKADPMQSGMDTWIGNDNVNVALVPGYTDHPNNAANARLIAAAPDLKSVADAFVITGPDADGFVWLQINSPNFPQRAAFNLGSAEHLAGKVALEFEKDRRAASAKAEGR